MVSDSPSPRASPPKKTRGKIKGEGGGASSSAISATQLICSETHHQVSVDTSLLPPRTSCRAPPTLAAATDDSDIPESSKIRSVSDDSEMKSGNGKRKYADDSTSNSTSQNTVGTSKSTSDAAVSDRQSSNSGALSKKQALGL